jgi:hypothetical protein
MDEKLKRGQAAIWIIVGIVFVAAIILLISFLRETEIITRPIETAPVEVQSFLESCTSESVSEAVDIMLPNGGFISPRNTIRFDGFDVAYICETIQPYDECIQQHPMLLREMELEIKDYISDEVENCFDDMKKEFRKRGWEMSLNSQTDFDVDLDPNKVVLDISKSMTIESKDAKQNFDKFYVELPSPAYDLAKVALEIASQEAKYCYFEIVGYSLTYPKFKIELYNQMPDSTKIYTITDSKSDKSMRIAVRSCAIPRGLQ